MSEATSGVSPRRRSRISLALNPGYLLMFGVNSRPDGRELS
jgi:hypothetical protein